MLSPGWRILQFGIIARAALIAFALALAGSLTGAVAHGGEPKAAPKFYTWHQYGATGGELGKLQAAHLTMTWPEHVGSDWIQDQLKWSGPDAGVALHLPFGYWRPEQGMEIDSLDFAAEAGLPLADIGAFVKAWSMEARERSIKAYVGQAHLHPRLNNMPIDDFRAKVERNLQPFAEAGFAGVIVDAAYDGIAKPAKLPATAKPEWKGDTLQRGPNRDTEILKIADGMFPERAAIEVGPRRFEGWADMQTRDAWYIERDFQKKHGPESEQYLTQGWGPDTSYIKGRIHRILLASDFNNDPEAVVERAREIVKAGHVPVVQAWWLNSRGVKPADFLEAN
jgi:hypothetical protein